MNGGGRAGPADDPRALADAIWRGWMEELAGLTALLRTLDDPDERALAGVVLRPRLHGAPPVVEGRPTPALGRLPALERETLVDNYRAALDDAFGDLYPDAPSYGVFERVGGPDPAGWRWNGRALMAWLAGRLPPARELTAVETRTGLLGRRREVPAGVRAAWRLPGGDPSSTGCETDDRGWDEDDYVLADGSCVTVASGSGAIDARSARSLGRADLVRLARAAGMGWLDPA